LVGFFGVLLVLSMLVLLWLAVVGLGVVGIHRLLAMCSIGMLGSSLGMGIYREEGTTSR